MQIKKISETDSDFPSVTSTVIEVTVGLEDQDLSPKIMGLLIYIDNPSDPYLIVENTGKYDAKAFACDRHFVIKANSKMHTIDLGFPLTIRFEATEDA